MKSRVAVLGVAALACVLVLTGCPEPQAVKPAEQAKDIKSIQFDNASFYDKDGKFLEDKAKDAYIAVMKYHGYPVYPKMREELWVSDYGTGQFTKLGLAARMWKNHEEHLFMLMDVYLLPRSRCATTRM
ncbi:hypothetical protein ACFL09_06795 [Planctomycetota bacterium]